MIDGHPGATVAALQRFSLGNASREESRSVVQHLLSGCRLCLRRTQRLWPTASWREDEVESAGSLYDYGSAFSGGLQAVERAQLELAEECAVVAERLAELRRHPLNRQRLLIRNSAHFRTWALAQAVLGDCETARRRDPVEGVALASLGVAIADALAPERYGRERVNDMRARARGELAAGLRCQNQLIEAEALLADARRLLEIGSGDPAEKAQILSYEASLWVDRMDFERASSLLDRVIALARRCGESQLVCKALLNQVRCDVEAGRFDRTVELSLEAQRLLDSSSDPRLALVLQHNVLFALTRAGRLEEAAAGLDDTLALHRQLDYPIDRLRFEWLRAEILFGLDRIEEAESLFRSTLEGFLQQGMHYDAALVALDLALLLLRGNRGQALEPLCSALIPVFRSEGVGREVIASFLILRQAVERERLTVELVTELLQTVRKTRRPAESRASSAVEDCCDDALASRRP